MHRYLMTLALLVAASAQATPNGSPPRDAGDLFSPYEQDPSFPQVGTNPIVAMTAAGYNVSLYRYNGSGTQLTLPDLADILADTIGVGAFVSHGHGGGFAVEVYPNTDAGRNDANDAYTNVYLAAGYTTAEVYVGHSAHGWSVSVTPAFIGRYAQPAGLIGLFISQGASGLSSWHASFAFGSTVDSSNLTQWNTIWTRLQDGSTATAALNGTVFSPAGNGAFVIRPDVESVQPLPGTTITGITNVRVAFSAAMNTVRSPAEMDSRYVFRILRQTWTAPDTLVVRLARVSWGTDALRIDAYRAKTPGGILLNGGRHYNASYTSNGSDNGAASLVDFAVFDGAVHFTVDGEYRTREYRILGSPTAGGPFDLLTTVAADGGGLYTVPVPPAAVYRLEEVEADGRTLFMAEDIARQPRQREDPPELDLDAIHQQSVERVQQYRQMVGEQPQAVTWYVLVAPQAWLSDLQPLIDLASLRGYGTILHTRESLPADPDSCRIRLQTLNHGYYQDGVRLVQLVGDDVDHPSMYGPQRPVIWSGSWAAIWQAQIDAGVQPQPERQIMPGWYILDQRPRGEGMTYFAPYYLTYTPYVDVNDDGAPDMACAVIPAASRADLVPFVDKVIAYEMGYPPSQRVVIASNDRDAFGNSGELVAAQVSEDLVPAVPQGVYATVLSALQIGGYWTERTAAVTDALADGPQVMLMLGTNSTKDRPVDFFAPGWSPTNLLPAPPTYVIAASCETAGFSRTEYPAYGQALGKKFLTVQNRGAIAWAGFSAGTWQDGDGWLAEEVLRQTYADPTRPLAVSAQLAVQSFLTQHPQHRELAESFIFSGFILTRLNLNGIPTDVAAVPRRTWLWGATPNPFNATTNLQFSVEHTGPAQLDIYDVRGARVRQLYNGVAVAGQPYPLVWMGTGDAGRPVSTGVYFVNLRSGGKSMTKKLTLLK